jgi:hypothetical protein
VPEGSQTPTIVRDARAILDTARERAVPLRALGGIAVFLHAPPEAAPRRRLEDMDFATSRSVSRQLAELLAEHGFEPDVAFNALHGARRMLFLDDANGRHVDVFVDAFEMCHVIPFRDRLEVEELTLPLAELLLTKLQIVQLNRKDVTDTCSLLAVHEVGPGDHETVNTDRIAELCAEDWGLFHTLELNLERVRARLSEVDDLDDAERTTVAERIGRIASAIEGQPKSRRWKMRARIGERKRWYEEPEEVDGSVAVEEAEPG